jgi:hypothetical protein
MKTLLTQFLSGAVALAFWAIGFFFMRFAAKTRDRFFTVFGWAFWVLAVERVALLLLSPDNEFGPYIYIIRLCAFLLIIGGIIYKNRSSPGPE